MSPVVSAGTRGRLKVNQVLFPASSSHYLASTFRPTRALLFTRGEVCMRDTPIRRQEKPAVCETDYLRRVLGRLLTANTSDRTSPVRTNDTTRDIRKFCARYIVNIPCHGRQAKRKVVAITFLRSSFVRYMRESTLSRTIL